MEFGQFPFETHAEALDDAPLLLGPGLGVAVEPSLAAFVVLHLLHLDGLTRAGFQGGGQVRVEAAGALPADHQVAVAVLPQPGDVVFGGHPRVHDHQRVRRGAQGFEHRRQSRVLIHRTGEHLGPAHEARAVQHQPQGQQRAVRALLLGMAPPGLVLGLRLALEIGVGQVVQRHRAGQPEQVRRPVEQVGLDGPAMHQQGVGYPVQAHRAHAPEVDVQKLPQGRAFAEPVPGGALGTRLRHPPDDGGQGQGPLRAAQSQPLQQGIQAELLRGPQPHGLDAHRARPDQFQGVHVHRVQIRLAPGCRRPLVEQLRGDVLGLLLDLRRAGQRHQPVLALEQLVDPGAQQGPVRPAHRKLAAEVEEGALADLAALAFVADQAVGVVDLAGVGRSGLCAPDEHGGKDSLRRDVIQYIVNRLCHYKS